MGEVALVEAAWTGRAQVRAVRRRWRALHVAGVWNEEAETEAGRMENA